MVKLLVIDKQVFVERVPGYCVWVDTLDNFLLLDTKQKEAIIKFALKEGEDKPTSALVH